MKKITPFINFLDIELQRDSNCWAGKVQKFSLKISKEKKSIYKLGTLSRRIIGRRSFDSASPRILILVEPEFLDKKDNFLIFLKTHLY